MTKPTTPAEQDKQERDEDLDALMADAFGTTAEDEYLHDEEELDLDEDPDHENDDEVEGDEEPEEEDEDPDDVEDDDDVEEDEDDDEDDEEDSRDPDDEPGESDPDATAGEGDGADDVVSDGLMALDMMADQMLASYTAPSDDFDPSTVGTEEEYVEAAREAFGPDYDEEHVKKTAQANYKIAVRTAKKRHEAGVEERTAARRSQDSARLTAQIHEIARVAPDELKRVDQAMARIYQEKVDKHGEDAAASLSAEVYFRLAGGKLRGTPGKAKTQAGVASRKAKAQKAGAVRGQQNPDQVGRVRTGKKKRRSKDEVLMENTNSFLNRKRAVDFLFDD